LTPEFQKSQAIRAVDVWLLGPLMILGTAHRKMPVWLKLVLGISGFLTMAYNAENYRLNAPHKNKPSI
jgi:hypothetical protein